MDEQKKAKIQILKGILLRRRYLGPCPSSVSQKNNVDAFITAKSDAE